MVKNSLFLVLSHLLLKHTVSFLVLWLTVQGPSLDSMGKMPYSVLGVPVAKASPPCPALLKIYFHLVDNRGKTKHLSNPGESLWWNLYIMADKKNTEVQAALPVTLQMQPSELLQIYKTNTDLGVS